MKRSNLQVEELQNGHVLLTRVRKVHNDPSKTSEKKDFKVQIEGAEYIDNPFRPVNATSVFNQGDQRFVGNKPRRGWVTLEPSKWDQFFGKQLGVSSEDISKLEFSSTSQGDIADPSNLIEGRHFIYIGVLDPVILYDNKQYPLHVKITESTNQRNQYQLPKLNPSNSQIQTLNGVPIYSTGILDFGKQKSIFLLSDQMKEAILNGTLPVSEEVIKQYNLVPVPMSAQKANNEEVIKTAEEEFLSKL